MERELLIKIVLVGILVVSAGIFSTIIVLDNMNYEAEVRYEASQYNPTLEFYKNEKIKAQTYIISHNEDCCLLIMILGRCFLKTRPDP